MPHKNIFYLVNTRNFLAITTYVSRNYEKLSRNNEKVSRNYEKLSRNYEIKTIFMWHFSASVDGDVHGVKR